MSKSSHILPTNNLAMEMAHSVAAIKISLGAFDLVNEKDLEFCRAYVEHLVRCYIEDRMLWVDHIRKVNKKKSMESTLIGVDVAFSGNNATDPRQISNYKKIIVTNYDVVEVCTLYNELINFNRSFSITIEGKAYPNDATGIADLSRYIRTGDHIEIICEADAPVDDDEVDHDSELLEPLLAWAERYPEALPRLRDIVDSTDEDVANTIARIIPDKTWNVWLTLKAGKDVVLTEEEDYRITDWMRRQQGGEWCDEQSNSSY